MWIVRLALRRPYTFVVAAILIVILGVVAIERTPTDIFPKSIFRSSALLGLHRTVPAGDVGSNRIWLRARSHSNRQRHRTHRIAIADWPAIVKVFFQPKAQHQRGRFRRSRRSRRRPFVADAAGHNPPFIITYNASTVPILQLASFRPGLQRTGTDRHRRKLHASCVS